MTAATSGSADTRVAFPVRWGRRGAFAALALYAIYAMSTLDVTWDRVLRGMDQGAKILRRLWPPNMQSSKMALIQEGMIESLQIAILATAVGVLFSVPLGLISARNLMPSWAAWIGRGVHRAVPHVPSRDRRDPVREGRGLRRACRHPRADRVINGLHLQAHRRGDRGDQFEAGRSRARDRRSFLVDGSSWGSCRR